MRAQQVGQAVPETGRVSVLVPVSALVFVPAFAPVFAPVTVQVRVRGSVCVFVVVLPVRCVMVVMPVVRVSPVKVSPVAVSAFTHEAYSGTPTALQPLPIYHL
ncbi:hypothetical protein [Kitasatospora sp. NPDC048407]|uniref:hypothetical protein n=1 Tax=Kitasatospora sp. NPDC048407 TaxID=3364051 RepID=UPI003721DEEC